MYYSSEEFLKRIPGDTRGIEAEKMLEWCAKDLGVPKPKMNFFFWHQNKKLYDVQLKRNEFTIESKQKIDGFYTVGKNKIWVYNDLSLKRTLHVIAHEMKHYQTDRDGTDNLMWDGDREQDAESYAHYAMRNYNITNNQPSKVETQVKPDNRKPQPKKEPGVSERFLVHQYLTNSGVNPNRGNY